jgi:deoxyribodipyrimidine photo-lyase
MQKLNIYWSIRDFRLDDNPALFACIQDCNINDIGFLPVFVLDRELPNSKYNIGYPQKLFLSRCLSHFAYNFSNLPIIKGSPLEIFELLSKKFEITVYVNEDVDPYSREQLSQIISKNIKVRLFQDQINVDKNTISGTGNLYSVFTPFKKNVWKQFLTTKTTPKPSDIPNTIKGINKLGLDIIDYAQSEEGLQQNIFKAIDSPWSFEYGDGNILNLDEIFQRPQYEMWSYKETDIKNNFDEFVTSGNLGNYKENRDNLGIDLPTKGFTSRMSVALKFGLISSRQLVQRILAEYGQMITEYDNEFNNIGVMTYLSELVWREFYKYILWHNPSILDTEFQPKYRGTINWQSDDKGKFLFEKWVKSETGYPIVDAAMKQIAKTGWMHNRSRMVVASILTKNLGIDWRWGQEYFRAVLLDLDEAANNGGWQWASSVGSDPKPIRIFNPYLQSENYDKQGKYQKLWLGNEYDLMQNPIIDHKIARANAQKMYSEATSLIASKNNEF